MEHIDDMQVESARRTIPVDAVSFTTRMKRLCAVLRSISTQSEREDMWSLTYRLEYIAFNSSDRKRVKTTCKTSLAWLTVDQLYLQCSTLLTNGDASIGRHIETISIRYNMESQPFLWKISFLSIFSVAQDVTFW